MAKGLGRKALLAFRKALDYDLYISRENVRPLAWIGIFGHPAYWVIWTYLFPQPYESFGLRLFTALVFVPLLFFDKVAEQHWFGAFKSLYWHIAVTLAIPFIFTFLLLMNNFGLVYLASTVIVLMLLLLLMHSLTTITASVVEGVLLGTLLFVYVSPLSLTQLDWLRFVVFLPLLLFAVFAGFIFTRALRRGMQLNERLHATEKLVLTLRTLAGSIAHEMRNPLGQIAQGMSQIEKVTPLVRDADALYSLSGKQITVISESLSRMEVALTRGGQSIDMTLEEVSDKPPNPDSMIYTYASKVIERAVNESNYASEDQRKAVQVNKLGTDFVFKVNETKYVFVMSNLIKNALHYFDERPDFKITIYIDGTKQQIRVCDNGPGIPREALADLFESFKTRGKKGGTGLGLPYVRRTVESFNGTVTCNSTLGEGAEFVMTFPKVSEATMAQEEKDLETRLQQRLKGKRVLVVDDVQEIRSRIVQTLASVCPVDEANDGSTALEALAKVDYGLVLMDINMEFLDGYEATGRIRHGGLVINPNVPVLAHTSNPPYLSSARIRKSGMDHFTHKPCTAFELMRAMHVCLDKARERMNVLATQKGLADKIILAVDDDEGNRDIVAKYLEPHGAVVVKLPSGKSALDYLQAGNKPDLIVIDMQMPGLDGFETTRRIRQSNAAYKNVPIVALSGDSFSDVIEDAKSAGVNDYIVKPFKPDELFLRLGKVLDVVVESPTSNHLPPLAKRACAVSQILDEEALRILLHKGMRSSVQRVMTTTLKQLTELSNAAKTQDIERARKITHALVGTAGMMHADALIYALKEVAENIYVSCWPPDDQWLESLFVLHQMSCKALETGFNLTAE